MYKIAISLILVFCSISFAFAQDLDQLKYVSVDELMIIGRGFEKSHVRYGRLPASMESRFRKELISLGKNSAGLAVRFSTDSKVIAARWTVITNAVLDHMPATGVKGLDLYTLENEEWIYAGTARNVGKNSKFFFVKNLSGENREYIAYFPLYDGIESLEIGIDTGAAIGKPQKPNLTKRPDAKPIVFYGTSITQGGCASRPGMAYPSILGRMLNRETINLGFSGNGKLDFAIAEAINMIDAGALVMDCLPNNNAQMVRDSAYRFITHIVNANPNLKIVMIENPGYPAATFDKNINKVVKEKNAEWLKLFIQLRNEGYGNIEYVRDKGLIGNDGEATVDGVHFTDLGFMRYAHALLPYLEEFKVPIAL